MEIKRLLEIHKKWVEEGDKQNRDADTYPLVHRAYEQRSDDGIKSSTSKRDEECTIMSSDDLCLNDDNEKREKAKYENSDGEKQDKKLVDEIFASSESMKCLILMK